MPYICIYVYIYITLNRLLVVRLSSLMIHQCMLHTFYVLGYLLILINTHNSLSLNMTKTDTIIISRPTYPLIITHPFLLALPTSQSITTLGFTINSHLDYSDHISIMIRNANYFLYNIRKSRNKLTFSMTKSLIHSLVFSRLIYCCSLLCNLPLKLMLKLEKIQRRAIRTLYKLKFSSIVSISTLMRSLGWLKFRYLCRYRLLCITHKVIHLRSPEYLADLISMHTLSRASRKCHTMKMWNARLSLLTLNLLSLW